MKIFRLLFVISFVFLNGRATVGDDQPNKTAPARTDLYGDLLPDGAIARIGTSGETLPQTEVVLTERGRTVLNGRADRAPWA